MHACVHVKTRICMMCYACICMCREGTFSCLLTFLIYLCIHKYVRACVHVKTRVCMMCYAYAYVCAETDVCVERVPFP